MKKFFLLLSVIALASCSSDEVENTPMHQSLATTNYRVDAEDVKKVVSDYFRLLETRAGGSNSNILSIESIGKLDSTTTRSSNEDAYPLLYAVKVSDGSTIIVGGDKRAESVYARFDNVDFTTDKNGQFTNDSIPDMVYYLIEDYMADVKNKIQSNASLNNFFSSNSQSSATRATDSDEEVQPKLSYRFTDVYNYNDKNNNYNLFTSQDVRPWTIHALCIAIPDGKEIRSFNKYQLKGSWKQAKKLNVTQLKGDLFTDFVEMSKRVPQFSLIPNSKISIAIALNSIKQSFSGADGIPSLSYDADWFNMLNNLRLETGISFIYGYRDRKHPTMFRHTSYSNLSFFLADGYKKIKGDYYIHVVGPVGNHGIVSGYVLDFNRTNAGRFQDTHWTEWYGVPYKTQSFNIGGFY